MRLLVVTQYFWPEAFRVNDLVEGMVARGHEVTVLTGQPNYPQGQIYESYRLDPSAFSSFAGATVVRVPVIPRGSNSIMLMLNYLSFVISGLTVGLWKLRGRPFDAIFVFQTSPITAALPALALRRMKKAPVLMWVLDLWPDMLSALGVVKSPALLGLVGKLVRFIYRRCDRILVQSRAFFANVEKYDGGCDRVRYFPNWVEPVFEQALEGVPAAPELTPWRDTFNVMFAGNIGECQDMPALIQAAVAACHIENLRWLIVGDGRAMDVLKRGIEENRLQDRVILLGRHPTERMPSFFAGADALLVSLAIDPVFEATIPGKVQSYMASGRPVLGMLDGEGARVIEESGGGLASPAGDAAALAANVQALVDARPAERAAMGNSGQAYARAHFDRDTLFDAMEGWVAEARAEFK